MAGLEEPGNELSDQAGAATCGADPGTCGDAGVGPVCVATGPRDCTSELDNDCDGQPDNVVEGVCVCALGTSEACDEHPGLDGSGPCLAGLRTCVLAADGLTSEWGACEGAVGPGGPDSCTVRGDDADCDGTPNTDCTCVDGDTQECGSPTDTGPCAIGISTCVDARFGPCVGATPPAAQDSCAPGDDSNCNGRANDRFCACLNGATQQCGVTATGVCELGSQTCVNGAFGQCVGARDPGSRDCRSQQDNNCDGRADNERDNTCRCSIGESQPCQTHPQDGIGRCRAGTQTCVLANNNSSSNFGACTGSQGPIARDCRLAQDNDCDGRPDNTIDGVCECIPGQGNGLCSGDPNNSRCNAQGQCAPCQNDGDCSLVASGRIECVDGECVAPLPPLDCSTALPSLATAEPSTRAIAGPPPAPQGGVILDGFYFKTEVRFYDGASAQPVPSSTIRIQAGTFIQRIGEFDSPIGGRVQESIAAGTLVTDGSSASFATSTCINGNSSGSRTNTVGYDASSTRLLIHRAGLVEVFDRT